MCGINLTTDKASTQRPLRDRSWAEASFVSGSGLGSNFVPDRPNVALSSFVFHFCARADLQRGVGVRHRVSVDRIKIFLGPVPCRQGGCGTGLGEFQMGAALCKCDLGLRVSGAWDFISAAEI